MFIVNKYKNFDGLRDYPDLYNHNGKPVVDKLIHIFNFYFKLDNSLQECLLSLMKLDSKYIKLFSGIDLNELNVLNYYHVTMNDKQIVKLYSERIANNFKEYFSTKTEIAVDYSKIRQLVDKRQVTINFNITLQNPDIKTLELIHEDIKNETYYFMQIEDKYIVRIPSYFYPTIKLNSKSYEYQII